ncbi:hypothetical protein Bbelb_023340 [Branchiostoma belcheri]|nr:hypothetical protein Bbelb_023340 [Branchiostoma belcheri]
MSAYQPDRASDRPTAEGRREIRSAGGLGPRNIWKPRAVRVKNPRAVPLVITRAGTPVSNVIAAQDQAPYAATVHRTSYEEELVKIQEFLRISAQELFCIRDVWRSGRVLDSEPRGPGFEY